MTIAESWPDRVEQAGFAGVGFAGNHHRHPLADQGTLAGLLENGVQLLDDGLEVGRDLAVGEKVDFLFREIDGRFHIDAQLDNAVHQRCDPFTERSLQGVYGIARRLFRGTVDQVGDGLGLGQVDLVVEKGALGELTRPGQAGALV